MSIQEIENYLEKKGARYFVALTMVFYLLGAVVFNIYLRSLDIFEFDILQLRYVVMGFVFFLLSFVGAQVINFGLNLLWRVPEGKQKTKKQKSREFRRKEYVLGILFLPWLWGYSLHIFPEIPAGFGGAKPIAGRLVGETEKIQRVNQLIAHETKIPLEKLAFETVGEEGGLSIGANVLILDRNKDRYFLLLTKELYLSSTSKLAKDLVEAGGDVEGLSLEGTRNFQPRPLIVKADGIEGVTFTLYEPPEILTAEDLAVAVSVLAAADTQRESSGKTASAAVVKKFIEQQAPTTGAKVLKEVQKVTDIKHQQEQAPTKEAQEKGQAEIEQVLGKVFNQEFLKFRAEMFNQSVNMANRELIGKKKGDRFELVRTISGEFQRLYPVAWSGMQADNYLIKGQEDVEFPRNVSRIFQGAEDAEVLVQRFNARKPEKTQNDFVEIRNGGITLLERTATENTKEVRLALSRSLVNYFNQKAKSQKEYGILVQYLSAGRGEEDFVENTRGALQRTTSWEELGTAMGSLYRELQAREAERKKVAEEAAAAEAAAKKAAEEAAAQQAAPAVPVAEPAPVTNSAPVQKVPADVAPASVGVPVVAPASTTPVSPTPVDATAPATNPVPASGATTP